MPPSHTLASARVIGIWRYPVKSMMGEELNAVELTERGLLGDRSYALVDVETGKVVSAKNPRRWPNMFEFRATYVEPPLNGERSLAAVRITLPDGQAVNTDQNDIEARLSTAVGRPIRLARSAPADAKAEGYWPDHDWLAQRDQIFDFALPAGTFFDGAAVHLVTTATLSRLQSLAPASRFAVPRFRPNLVIETADADGFIEKTWIGRTLGVGGARLRIDGPCPRCIMTTLSQGGLPKDPNVLRAAVQGNAGNVGVYASVVQSGPVRLGDALELS